MQTARQLRQVLAPGGTPNNGRRAAAAAKGEPQALPPRLSPGGGGTRTRVPPGQGLKAMAEPRAWGWHWACEGGTGWAGPSGRPGRGGRGTATTSGPQRQGTARWPSSDAYWGERKLTGVEFRSARQAPLGAASSFSASCWNLHGMWAPHRKRATGHGIARGALTMEQESVRREMPLSGDTARSQGHRNRQRCWARAVGGALPGSR